MSIQYFSGRRLTDALCECPQRPFQDQDKDRVQPHQAPAYLFQRWCGYRRSHLPFDPAGHRQHRGAVRYTEKKLLQAQHRLEEAQARDRVKERKARTRRLIQEGAILEKVLPEVRTMELSVLEDYLMQKLPQHD